MKISKKVLIPVFASAMGLAVIGGVSGSVAWYQYNSKVTTNFVGVSVEDKGVLQISEDGSAWTRSIDKTGNPDKMELKPVTFGATADGMEGKDAWMYPEAGAGIGYYGADSEHPNNPHWESATAGTDFVQFDLYFNAYENDSSETGGKKYVQKSVHISDSFIRCLNSTSGAVDTDHIADQAMRIQIDVDGGSSFIIAKAAANTNLYGGLDLDGTGNNDSYHNNPFITLPTGAVVGEEIVYGVDGETQAATAISTYAVGGTELFKTSGTATPVKVTVTMWLEGWAMLNSSAIWAADKTAGCDVQVALEFTTAE